MGWSFVTYEQGHEQFNDFDLWTLRHFLSTETAALEAARPDVELSELRSFFECWNWLGPGVFTGTDFSSFVQGSHTRWDLVFNVLQRTADRIATFGEFIPVAYLAEHVNTTMARWSVSPPTRGFLAGIGRICNLLSKHEPPIA